VCGPLVTGDSLLVVTKLNWEKAKPKQAPKPPDNRKSAMLREEAMAEYVAKHDLVCFKCGTREAEWAKTGRSGRGPWAICVNCVRAS
jgi:hypothetical protein